jgi:hypothetical protein
MATIIQPTLQQSVAIPQLKARLRELIVYGVIILVAVISWESQDFMKKSAAHRLALQGGIAGEVVKELSNVQTKQLDAYLELNRLLTTLGTTLLGAIFFLMFNNSRFVWKRRTWAAILGTLSICVSIFFSYVAYLFFIASLGDGDTDITRSLPHWAQQAHFYTFLLGVVFFADFIFHNLPQEATHANQPSGQR